MSTIKVQKKGQVTLPTALRERVGVAYGDLLEVTVNRGSFVLRPKRTGHRTNDDEYTPEQRRAIDKRLAKAMAEAKSGKLSPAFATAKEMADYLRKTRPTIKRPRA